MGDHEIPNDNHYQNIFKYYFTPQTPIGHFVHNSLCQQPWTESQSSDSLHLGWSLGKLILKIVP